MLEQLLLLPEVITKGILDPSRLTDRWIKLAPENPGDPARPRGAGGRWRVLQMMLMKNRVSLFRFVSRLSC